jgi:hypothetical protein
MGGAYSARRRLSRHNRMRVDELRLKGPDGLCHGSANGNFGIAPVRPGSLARGPASRRGFKRTGRQLLG